MEQDTDTEMRNLEVTDDRTIAVVLHSGGLDSSTLLTDAVVRYNADNVFPLGVSYGQKHSAELRAAQDVRMALGIPETNWQTVSLPSTAFAGSGSALVQSDADAGAEMPHLSYDELAEAYGPSPTYVPFRNGTLLSLATARALSLLSNEGSGSAGARAEVWFGAHAEDAHNFAYPDCTPEFIGAMANAIYVGSYFRVRLVTPVMWMTKAQIVRWGVDIGAPLGYTMSCYEGTTPACGVCPTCVGRLEAFAQNGLTDPIAYSSTNGREFSRV